MPEESPFARDHNKELPCPSMKGSITMIQHNPLKVHLNTHESRPPYDLVRRIIARSVVDHWHEAKQEWRLERVLFTTADNPGKCLCGQFPVLELCYIRNYLNDNLALVGNRCVTRFMELLEAEQIFAAMKRVSADHSAALNATIIEYAYGQCYINDWERSFCLDVLRKRKLSAKKVKAAVVAGIG